MSASLRARVIAIAAVFAMPLGARAASGHVIEPWTPTAAALECRLVSTVAEGLRALQLEFQWNRESGTRLSVEARFASSDIRDFVVEAPSLSGAVRIEAKDAAGSVAGEDATRLLALVARSAPWSITAGRVASGPVRFETPVEGRVAAAMFEACIAANLNPRALTSDERSALVSGPMEAPRFMSVTPTPTGCRLAGSWLADRPLEFRFDTAATGDLFRIGYMPTFDTSKPRKRLIDLTSLGGGKSELNEDIQFSIPRDIAGALRTDVLAGKPRAITITEKKIAVAELGFGMTINEPVIRMFGACIAALESPSDK